MRLAPASQPAQKRKEPINLLKGSPNPSLHPTRLLLQAAQTVLSDPSLSTPALGYGPEQGHPPLLANLATWLTNFYQPCTGAVTAERLAITGGASQNLGNMLAVFTDPEATLAVWLVAPAYFLAFGIFEDAGLAMRAVPEDEQGLDLEYLDREIGRCETEAAASEKKDPTREATKTGTRLKREGKLYRHVIYCVPSFSNPSGRTMSPDRRRELVRLARRYDALVICDDVYDFLQWPARGEDTLEEGYDTLRPATAALPRLVDIDRELDGGTDREGADGFGNAISNGSFSKIAGPGLRCGWVEGTEKFAYGVSQTGTTISGGAPSHLTSTYLSLLLEPTNNFLESHIQRTLLPAYRRRYALLLSAIEAHLLPLGFTLPQPDRDVLGGYFAWLRLPNELECDARTLAERCLAKGVIIAPGELFEVPGTGGQGGGFGRHVRLCWAWEDEELFAEGLNRVADVVEAVLKEQKLTEGGEGSDVSEESEGWVRVDRSKEEDTIESI